MEFVSLLLNRLLEVDQGVYLWALIVQALAGLFLGAGWRKNAKHAKLVQTALDVVSVGIEMYKSHHATGKDLAVGIHGLAVEAGVEEQVLAPTVKRVEEAVFLSEINDPELRPTADNVLRRAVELRND